MELQDLTPAGDRVEEVEVEEEEEEETRQMLDVEVKQVESCVYNTLKTPTEDIYSMAVWPSTKDEADLQIHGKLRLYRALCFLLSLICLVLLFVVIILRVKFPAEALVCPEREGDGTEEAVGKVQETRQSPPMCSVQKCKDQHPQFGSSPCQPCDEGWLLFEDSCFFLSRERQSWEDSRKYCRARGGDLAVITNDRVQNFLTEEGNLLYWIGLRYKAGQWTWVTSAAMTKSYWGGGAPVGDCGLLLGNKSTKQSWNASPCFYGSAYICQTQRRHFPPA